MAQFGIKRFLYVKKVKKRILCGPLVHKIVKTVPIRISRNWLFQGTLCLDLPELIFRTAVEFALLVSIYIGMSIFLSTGLRSLFTSFIISHSIMWLFNSHFWALTIGGNKRLAKNRPEKIILYLTKLRKRLENTASIKGCVIFGSLSRGEFTENSDLDILCIKNSGFLDAICAYTAGIRERFLAFCGRIPIELYFYSLDKFIRLDENERPVIMKDEGHAIRKLIRNGIQYESYPFKNQEFFNKLTKKDNLR